MLFFSISAILFLSCNRKVIGDVEVYGKIYDAYDNTPVSNVELSLYRKNTGNSATYMEGTYTIDASGNYSYRYPGGGVARKGYIFQYRPLETGKYYFDGSDSTGEYMITDNKCEVNVGLKRTGHMQVRIIDVPPYNYPPYLQFNCDGNYYPYDLYSFDGDTTFYVQLAPNRDNFYELTSRYNNNVDTIISGVINMDLSGDTLYQTLQF